MRGKYKIIILNFLILVFGFSVSAKNLIPELSHGGMTHFRQPPIATYTFPNGFQLYLLEDHQLPLFEARIFVQVGDAYEPAGLTGLADVVANVLVTGGSEKKTPQELDELQDEKAIHLTSDSGRELTNVTVTSVSNQWREALSLLREVLLFPRWDKERFQLAISHYEEKLRRDQDEPEIIAERAFRQAIYGEKHPWGRVPTKQTLGKIRTEDLKEFYQQFFHPNRMLLAVAGDFSSIQVKQWVQDEFMDLKPLNVAQPNWEKLSFNNKPETKKIKMKVNQAFIEAGHLGLERLAQEEYAYGLLQYILGGEPFTSRLGVDIRSDRGLAYTIYSDWDANPVRGLFDIHVQTKVESADAVLERIQENLKQVSQNFDITDAELKRAQEAMLNKYVFWFDSPFNMISMRAKLDLLGFPRDYLQKYPDRLRSVRLADLQKIAKEYIQPDKLKVVIVGP